MREKKDLIWILKNKYFDRLVRGDGPNIFIVDTGVIIDLENSHQNNGRVGNTPAEVLQTLERQYPLIITSKVLDEIRVHREMMIGGRFEISPATSILAYSLHDESKEIMEANGRYDLEQSIRDFHRYNVRLAANEAFKYDTRKGEKEDISETDINIVSTALDLSLGTYLGMPVSCVNVLSPDRHVVHTINLLKSSDKFKSYRVRAIPSRDDLRSYIK